MADGGAARDQARDDGGAVADAYRAILSDTMAYRIGCDVLDSRRSPWRMATLPWRLIGLARADSARARAQARAQARASAAAAAGTARRAAAQSEPADAAAVLVADVLVADVLVADVLTGRRDAAAALAALAPDRTGDAAARARLLLDAARALAPLRPLAAQRLAAAAARIWPPGAAAAAQTLAEAGALAAPAALMAASPADAAPPWLARTRDAALLAAEGLPTPPRAPRAAPRGAAVAYVAHLSEPHHRSGYAVRTRHMVQALAATGLEMLCATRPGYPWDRRDAIAVGDAADGQMVGDVAWRRFPAPALGEAALSDFWAAAADRLEEWLTESGAGVVIAGSNHVNAAPALIAARRLGLPFIYDVRGLWEDSEASRRDGWERTERYRLARRLETQIAAEADGVCALGGALAAHLADRGVDPARIVVAPNGVDAAAFDPQARAPDLRARAGADAGTGTGAGDALFAFVGSMERYEGLDLIVAAMARSPLRDRMRLVAVGGGPGARAAMEAAMAAGFGDRVTLTGRVAPEEAARWLAAADAAVYPRRDETVCRLVPPLKPLEAMAAGRPVIVSDLPALRDLVGGEQTATLVPPGDVAALSAAMTALADDAARRARLAAAGRRFVAAERSWQTACAPLAALIAALR